MTARRYRLRLLLAGLLFIQAASCTAAAEPISPEQISVIRELVKPDASEGAWCVIPWLTSLEEARKQAAAAGKPILLWEMDGHPLACT